MGYPHSSDLFPNSTPVLADIKGNGRADLFIGGGLNHIFRIDLGTLQIVDTVETGQHINSAISVADLDGDGRETVLAGNKSGTVFAYGASQEHPDGALLWRTEYPSRPLYAAPVLTDCDGDDGTEALIFPLQGDFIAAPRSRWLGDLEDRFQIHDTVLPPVWETLAAMANWMPSFPLRSSTAGRVG